MKNVSETFKEAIKQYGRQIDVIIEYTENGIEKFLDVDTLFSVTPIVNSNLLKSVMKQLNFESSVKVPKGTWINVRFGVLIEKGLTVQEVHQMRVDRLNSTEVRMIHGFEYINLGKYLVAEEPEYNADTLSYSHKCFDRMIFAMQNYEVLNIEYPITLKNFLYAVANKLNINVKNADFYNQNREIQKELYEGLEYTYRDVLDEIAQATGSIICINDNDELEVRYLNNTNETIDEGFLKDVNVTMKEKYGTINTIVLSRSAGTDNIYYPETLPENPIEIKISDNQIMNWNDRSDYLPELYQALNGIEYYVNDFKSTGITYLEVGDKYNIQIGENTYNCVLLNDEIDITQGLEEQIYTDMPEQSTTDYTKADKTDRRINQTNFIIDKQNQTMNGIIAQIGDRSQKTTTITADIDGINSRVEDIEDITSEVEGTKTITLQNCVEGSLLELHIYGNNTVFDYLRASNSTIISDTLKVYGDSEIQVTDEKNNTTTYELGIKEVLRQNGNIKDEYILEKGNAKIIRKINANGTIKSNEETENLGEYSIKLAEGTNIITIKNYTASLKVKFAIQSDFTDVFATRVEMNSTISQTAEEINLEVRKKVDENEIISKINQSAEAVTIDANKISLNGKDIDLTGDNITISSNNFTVDKNGKAICSDITITGGNIDMIGDHTTPTIRISDYSHDELEMYPSNFRMEYYYQGNIFQTLQKGGYYVENESTGENTKVWFDGIVTPTLTQTSKEESKKNFEEYKDALKTIKNIDIYKYNLKNEQDQDKKHIGFVIGDNFNYSEEVTSKNNDGVDIYSFVSLCCQAIKEQQQKIEELERRLEEK